MRILLKLVVGFLVVSIILVLWNIAIAPEFKKIPFDYKLFLEHEGTTSITKSFDDQTLETIQIKEVTSHRVINIHDNILEIKAEVIVQNIETR